MLNYKYQIFFYNFSSTLEFIASLKSGSCILLQLTFLKELYYNCKKSRFLGASQNLFNATLYNTNRWKEHSIYWKLKKFHQSMHKIVPLGLINLINDYTGQQKKSWYKKTDVIYGFNAPKLPQISCKTWGTKLCVGQCY